MSSHCCDLKGGTGQTDKLRLESREQFAVIYALPLGLLLSQEKSIKGFHGGGNIQLRPNSGPAREVAHDEWASLAASLLWLVPTACHD